MNIFCAIFGHRWEWNNSPVTPWIKKQCSWCYEKEVDKQMEREIKAEWNN